MDPKTIIHRAAEEETYYFDLPHALQEADKDGISSYDIEEVMVRGKINQRRKNRYRLRYNDIQIVVEIVHGDVHIITVMRDKKEG